eukprot:5669576-Pleurochrysis_carterae.AAC.1
MAMLRQAKKSCCCDSESTGPLLAEATRKARRSCLNLRGWMFRFMVSTLSKRESACTHILAIRALPQPTSSFSRMASAPDLPTAVRWYKMVKSVNADCDTSTDKISLIKRKLVHDQQSELRSDEST